MNPGLTDDAGVMKPERKNGKWPMGMVGIEPTLPSGNGFLRPARLPVPPHPQMKRDYREPSGYGQAGPCAFATRSTDSDACAPCADAEMIVAPLRRLVHFAPAQAA